MADLALPLTEGVLAVDPSNVTAQKLRVWNLLMIGRLADAVSRGTTYLRQHPEDSNTAWALTMAHALLDGVDDAAGVAERGLRADQANFSLWLLLGYVQLAAGEASRARRTWERGTRAVLDRLGESSTNYRALAYVANMRAALGQPDQALDMVQHIERADPYNGYLNYRLAHVVAELGELERAVRLIESAADSGFLSVQMLRCEERVCALARLAGDEQSSTSHAVWKRARTNCGLSIASCFPPSLLRRRLPVETEPVRYRRDAPHRGHPVQEDGASEVVDFVLDHPGDVAREALLVLLAIFVKVAHVNRPVARHARP